MKRSAPPMSEEQQLISGIRRIARRLRLIRFSDLLLRSLFYALAAAALAVAITKITPLPYPGAWVVAGFCLASLKHDPPRLSPDEVDRSLAARSLTGLRFYDGLTHRGMFSLPRYIREAMGNQTRLITDKEPLYLYTA